MRTFLRNFLLLTTVLGCTHPEVIAPEASPQAAHADDPFVWLEDIGGQKSLDFVAAANKLSLGELPLGELSLGELSLDELLAVATH